MKVQHFLVPAILLAAPIQHAYANVVTDWDEKAIGVIQGNAPAPARIGPVGAYRIMAVMHLAMFEAVNAIDVKYEAYKINAKPDVGCSQDAAAASAAAKVLMTMHPESAPKIKEALDAYLDQIPNGAPKDQGRKLGEEMGSKVLALRAKDGSEVANGYRPITQPGVYTGTQSTASWEYATVTPFALKDQSQFRPLPPVALTSKQWADDYNEIKELGEKDSTKRTARQTEDARFWLTVGPLATHPLARQVAIKKGMSVVDTARLMAIISATEVDASIAVK